MSLLHVEDEQLQFVKDCVEAEGFDYAFAFYSDFKQVKDEEFHRLRNEYLAAREALSDYIDAE
jgi:hypothetical protein